VFLPNATCRLGKSKTSVGNIGRQCCVSSSLQHLPRPLVAFAFVTCALYILF
jgi:hypothetical protein